MQNKTLKLYRKQELIFLELEIVQSEMVSIIAISIFLFSVSFSSLQFVLLQIRPQRGNLMYCTVTTTNELAKQKRCVFDNVAWISLGLVLSDNLESSNCEP